MLKRKIPWQNYLEHLFTVPIDVFYSSSTNAYCAELVKLLGHGKYQFVRKIARAGESIILEGQHQTLQRGVVLKIASPAHNAKGQQIIEKDALDRTRSVKNINKKRIRFLDGARYQHELHSTINSRYGYIPSVIDAGAEPFVHMIMPLIGGAHFLDYCRNVTEEKVLKLIYFIAKFLEEIHYFEIIHRDIKPSNILVVTEQNGDAKPVIIDWGFYKDLKRQGLTADNQMIGSPVTMSPQAMCHAALCNDQDDIYSLALVMWSAYNKRVPDLGLSADQMRDRVALICAQKKAYDPMQLPPKIRKIFEKAIEPERKNRYQLAKDFAQDLEAVLLNTGRIDQGKTTVERPPPKTVPKKKLAPPKKKINLDEALLGLPEEDKRAIKSIIKAMKVIENLDFE